MVTNHDKTKSKYKQIIQFNTLSCNESGITNISHTFFYLK